MSLKDFLKPDKKKIVIMGILFVLTIVVFFIMWSSWSVPVLDTILAVLCYCILILPFTLMYIAHLLFVYSNIQVPDLLREGYIIMITFAVIQLIYWYLLACFIAHFSAGLEKKKGKKK